LFLRLGMEVDMGEEGVCESGLLMLAALLSHPLPLVGVDSSYGGSVP